VYGTAEKVLSHSVQRQLIRPLTSATGRRL
jgi:hypothetical protein